MPPKNPLKALAELFAPVESRLPKGTFSPLARAIDAAPQDRATGEQWANYFVNRNAVVGGQSFPVRPEELRMTGVGDALMSDPTHPMSRADLIATQLSNIDNYPQHTFLGARPGNAGEAEYEIYQSPGPRRDYREELTHIPSVDYDAPHFDENANEGLISHSRSSLRKLPSGRAVHVDEIQSDLHQAARDAGGYSTPDSKARAAELGPEVNRMHGQIWTPEVLAEAERQRGSNSFMRNNFTGIANTDNHPLMPEYQEMRRQLNGLEDAPPWAPYAKTYHEQEFNKALRRAAEQDADKVTWTTGKQQASRWGDVLYDDAKNIRYDSSTNQLIHDAGKYSFAPNDRGKMVTQWREEQSLPALFGNETAQRLLKGEVIPEGWIGGGGMRNAYDGDITKYAGSFARRFPGAKVGDVAFRNAPSADNLRHEGGGLNRQMLLDNLRNNGIPFNPLVLRDFWPMVERFAAGDRDENLLADAIRLGLGEQSNLTPSMLTNMIDNNLYAVNRNNKASLYDKAHGLTLGPEARQWINRYGLPIASASPLAVMSAQEEE